MTEVPKPTKSMTENPSPMKAMKGTMKRKMASSGEQQKKTLKKERKSRGGASASACVVVSAQGEYHVHESSGDESPPTFCMGDIAPMARW